MQLTEATTDELDFDKMDGLLPAIVQHVLTGEILMQGFMNQDAIKATLKTGKVTFFSRSKSRLWTKGEASGNYLELVSAHTDCDKDSILVMALPAGPTCHLGSRSCFSDDNHQATPLLQGLADTIHSRRQQGDEAASYTAQLLKAGTKRAAQKVGEEGVEVALAAAAGDDQELLNESADLLYHLLVVLESRDLTLAEVLKVLLQRRQG